MTDAHHHVGDWLQRLIRLKLWHAATVTASGELTLEDAVRQRTGIFHMTIFSGPRELGLEEDRQGWAEVLRRLRVERDEAADIEEFEHRGLLTLWPHAEPMIEVEIARFDEFCSTAEGPFTFEIANYYADDHQPPHLTLHVRNCYRPASLFEHRPQTRQALLAVIERAADLRPDVAWIQCGSWLNSLPPFAKLFPHSWTETAIRGKPGGHMGWWGQFQDRRGGFHEANARRFRATGEFPHRHLICHCRIEELKQHLQRH